jgi:ABC-type lipoprotein export system ATPase subunit
MLLQQVRQRKIGALIATHNLALADQMDRAVQLKIGQNIVPF